MGEMSKARFPHINKLKRISLKGSWLMATRKLAKLKLNQRAQPAKNNLDQGVLLNCTLGKDL
jgi:hypothetical protein